MITVGWAHEVKVIIVHDPRLRDGYGIRTAYPWNDDKAAGNEDDEE